MKVNAGNIKVKERIRKEYGAIDELAQDIAANGLINPITVMALNVPFADLDGNGGTNSNDGGEYQLLAGLRRLKAVKSLDWAEIPVNVVTPADAEQALRIEISENEQRKEFTFSEKMEFGRLIEEIERAKAKERKAEYGEMFGRGREKKVEDLGPQPIGRKTQTRDIVGEKIGMSGKQYDRAKYVVENASQDVIDELDKGERTIRGTYDELRAKEKAETEQDDIAVFDTTLEKESEDEEIGNDEFEDDNTEDEDDELDYETEDIPFVDEPPAAMLPMPTPPKPPAPTKFQKLEQSESERLRKLNEYESLSPESKVAELERRLDEEHLRANRAESVLADFKYKTHNDIYHRDCEIVRLKNSNAELVTKLEEAESALEAAMEELKSYSSNLSKRAENEEEPTNV